VRITATTLRNFAVPVAVVVVWELTGRLGTAPTYLSSPSAIAAALNELARDGELGPALIASLYRVLAGFLIGAGSGCLLGVAAGMVAGVRNFFDPLVSFLNSVPKITFLPIFLLLFGLGHLSKISIIAFSVFFPVFVASRHAAQSVNKTFIWAAQNMGASSQTVFWRVIIPAAAPHLFAGIRIGLAHSFVVLFAAELIGVSAGLGSIVSEGEEWVRFDIMFAGIFCFAALGFASDRVLMAIRNRVLKGQTIGTEEQV
jgi:ABC-type nitrate/sulfonate/bicarbonate transport system permease component